MNPDHGALAGTVFDVQRFALHDGPGIRTTVFLKGCPLDCLWCHNPESRCHAPQLSFDRNVCTTSGACVEVCPTGALSLGEGGLAVDFAACTACGVCVDVCPTGALRIVGATSSVDGIMAVVRRDHAYYERSRGGLTLSGGEPTAQPSFALDLLARARSEGIHTCLDTCGHTSWSVLKRFVPLVDLFLYDYKASLDADHRRMTGVSNRLVLANLERLLSSGASVVLRCPLVPGVNDSDEHLAAIGRLCSEHPELDGVEIMPYHDMGRAKAERLGLDRKLGDVPPASDAQVGRWLDALRVAGCPDVRTG